MTDRKVKVKLRESFLAAVNFGLSYPATKGEPEKLRALPAAPERKPTLTPTQRRQQREAEPQPADRADRPGAV